MGSLRGNKENWNWAAKKFWSGAWVQNKKIPAGSLVGKKKKRKIRLKFLMQKFWLRVGAKKKNPAGDLGAKNSIILEDEFKKNEIFFM